MLDYAANAQAYWPRDRIKALAAENIGSIEELDTWLLEFLGSEGTSDNAQDLDAYWDTVERNLRNGEVRLLFVADEIPTELRRLIEFLNEHMPLVEVLGVEIRQYEGPNIRALVPRVVGQTEFARQQKEPSGRTVGRTTEKEFLTACPENTRSFFNRLFSESTQHGYIVSWGQKGFSVRVPTQDGELASFFYGYPPGVNGSPVPLFQAYLGSIGDQRLHDAVHDAFSKHIPFVLRGKHTLELALDDEGLGIATSGLFGVLDVAKRAANGEVPDPDAP